jgi:hypothetical protein
MNKRYSINGFLLLITFSLILFSSCSKPKKYTCKKGCITLAIEGQLVDLNNATATKSTPYKILFMPTNSTWVDFSPELEYVVQEGMTESNGQLKTNIKVDQELLKSDYSIYVRYFPTESFHFCKNPPLHEIATVPIDNFDKHTLSIYQRKKIKIYTHDSSLLQYDKRELLIGAPTECTFGFTSVTEMNHTGADGVYDVYALMNKSNLITIKKTRLGTPNIYEWITDSVYVDEATQDFIINY